MLSYHQFNNCDQPIVLDEIDDFIKHTKPVNIIGYFNDVSYEVRGFVLGLNDNNYKYLSKGKVEKIIYKNVYTVQITQEDVESDYYTLTTHDYFKNVNELDLLNTALILLHRNCDTNKQTIAPKIPQTIYAKNRIITLLEDKMKNINLLNYYELCQLYLYTSTNVDLMNMPVEKYASNTQLQFDVKTNQIMEGYLHLENEMKDLKRIINDMYTEIRNYMTFAF